MTEASYTYAETEGAPGAPLVFTFHGTGGTEQQFHRFASDLVPGAHVISPRGVSRNMALCATSVEQAKASTTWKTWRRDAPR